MISQKNKKFEENVNVTKDNSVLLTNETNSYITLTTEMNVDTDNEKLKSMKKIYSQVLWKKVFLKYKYYKNKGYYLN